MTGGDWHGTPGGAMRHWRAGERPCDPCLRVKRRTAKAATLDRERGNPRMVELGEAAHGIIAATPRLQLAEATGLMVHKLSRLHTAGPNQRVHRRTRDRILAAGGQKFWTPIGIQRRLRALQAIGWSARAVAAEMGTEETTLRNLIRREHPQFVRRTYAERIIAVYDRLSTTPRTGRGAARACNTAAAKGWPPPAVWEDIDDVNEDPMLGAPSTSGSRTAAQRLADEETERQARIEDLWWLAETGTHIERVAHRFGITVDAIERFLRYHGELELLAALRNPGEILRDGAA